MPSKKPDAAPVAPIETYGCKIEGKDQFFYDRWAFAYRIPIDQGAPRRFDLFKRVATRLNPRYFEWHDWTERAISAACEYGWVGYAGAAGSAKTHNLAGFACAWWLCAPSISSVIFCSTTAKALRKRGWANVQSFFTSVPGPRIGNFVDSRMMWQANKGDDKHAIVGIAVEEGETNKVADNIKGVHTIRQLVIIDEATAVPHAISDACTNLYSYPREFLLFMMANPRNRLDEFGRFIEPAAGWQSVSVQTEEWETTPKIDGRNGICVRFDAERSPNIVEGRLVSRHLPTKERVEARKRAAGSENDPTYWSNERGFPPPEGLNKNVFSESMLITHDAYGPHEFTGSNFIIIGVLDPARTGGDRIVVRFAKLGEVRGGNWGLQVGEPIPISINSASTNPIDYQITEQVERECAKVECFGKGLGYWCAAEHFGVDATGGGADLVDIMQRTWSTKVVRIGFGEAASEDPVSHEDIRLACDVYKNRRAEMYFRSANCVKSNQLKGIDKDTAAELVTIEFLDDKAKIVLMNKGDYKSKFGKSPDFADTVVMLVELARRLGFKLAAIGKTVDRGREQTKLLGKVMDVYATVSYEEEENTREEDEAVPSFYGD